LPAARILHKAALEKYFLKSREIKKGRNANSIAKTVMGAVKKINLSKRGVTTRQRGFRA
jgi:hypothetical protein